MEIPGEHSHTGKFINLLVKIADVRVGKHGHTGTFIDLLVKIADVSVGKHMYTGTFIDLRVKIADVSDCSALKERFKVEDALS